MATCEVETNETETQFCILVLIGLPAVGKTKFVSDFREFLKTSEDKSWRVIHVCYDELVPLEKQKEIVEDETENWKEYRKSISKAVNDFISNENVEREDELSHLP